MVSDGLLLENDSEGGCRTLSGSHEAALVVGTELALQDFFHFDERRMLGC